MTSTRRNARHRLALAWAVVSLTWLAGCATPVGSSNAPEAAQPATSASPAAPAMPAPAVAAIPAPTAAPDTTQADGRPFVFALDPLRPTKVVDIEDASVRTDLWIRIRAGFAIPDLHGELVIKWEQWYASRPDYVDRMTERGSRYLFHVVEEIHKRGMPTDLALLPFIESAFNPTALSGARASGMWQFMPATGKDFDLKQNLFRDDRRDVLASTRAALDYLQMLHEQFGDWQLALAAYNWGQGNVRRAIARNLKAGRPADYEHLRMPDETRNYVPKLQAVKNIVLRPAAYGVQLPAIENHPYFLSVPITRDIDVEVAANLAGLPLEEFRMLNPQMNKPVILAAGTPQVLLPFDNAAAFVRNLRLHDSPQASWTAWVAPATMKPAEVARRVGMSEADLRSVNRIPPRMLVKAGSTLLVPRGHDKLADVPVAVADNATMALAPEKTAGRRLVLKAGKRGDSVAAVAKRYRVSAAQVAEWNVVDADARFKPGQTIVVYRATASKSSSVKRVAAKPAKATAAASRSAEATGRKTAKASSLEPAAVPAPNKRTQLAESAKPVVR